MKNAMFVPCLARKESKPGLFPTYSSYAHEHARLKPIFPWPQTWLPFLNLLECALRARTESVATPLIAHTADHMLGSADQPASNSYPCADLLTSSRWTITPCEVQPPAANFELTHTRKLPLPLAVDVVFSDKAHRCLYTGHGQSKVV